MCIAWQYDCVTKSFAFDILIFFVNFRGKNIDFVNHVRFCCLTGCYFYALDALSK